METVSKGDRKNEAFALRHGNRVKKELDRINHTPMMNPSDRRKIDLETLYFYWDQNWLKACLKRHLFAAFSEKCVSYTRWTTVESLPVDKEKVAAGEKFFGLCLKLFFHCQKSFNSLLQCQRERREEKEFFRNLTKKDQVRKGEIPSDFMLLS